MIKYKDWYVTYFCKPIPDRNHDWEASHTNYDGAPDSDDDRAVTGPTLDDVKCQIDNWREI